MASTPLSDPLATRARKVDDKKYYIAEIHQPSKSLIFRAFVPESFNLSIQNHWEPIFGDINQGTSIVSRGAQALGLPINVKPLSRQIWIGTEPIEMTFTFHIDSYSNTEKDVEEPIKTLARMGTPIRKDGGIFLEAPGPSLISDENRLYLRIGRFFTLDSIILRNIDITFYTVADRADGRYMSADINVTLATAYTPDQADILNYFAKGQAGGDPGANASSQIPGGETLEKLKNAGSAAIDSYRNSSLDQIIGKNFNFF